MWSGSGIGDESKTARGKINAQQLTICPSKSLRKSKYWDRITLMKSRQTLAIIGSGPSCIYLLKNLLD
ncbi:MAG: hypothetical protein ABI992_10800, partial [Chthoniobacterales bacterium]